MKMIDEEGMGALYGSLLPIMARSLPYTMVQLATFETVTSALYTRVAFEEVTDARVYKFAITLTSAFIAATLASLASQPGDALLTKTNSILRSTKGRLDSSPLDKMINDAKELGIVGLFAGYRARLVHIGTIVVIQLLAYDTVKQMVRKCEHLYFMTFIAIH